MTEQLAGDDLRWAHDTVVDVSRTFAITIEQLDPPMADWICIGYLLCRTADTIEDTDTLSASEQEALLEQYNAVVAGDEPPEAFAAAVEPHLPEPPRSDDWALVANATRVLDLYHALEPEVKEAMREPVMELVAGMQTFVSRYADVGGIRIESLAELERYSWYVAGTVGKLITNILASDATPTQQSQMRENAESFALLLQLVNVAKDVGADYRDENNVYLPQEWLSEAGVEADSVTDPQYRDAVASVILRLTDHAAAYVDDAHEYLLAMPETRGNTLGAWAIPQLLAVGTLRELREDPAAALQAEAKVSRAEVYALLQRFEDGVSRDELDRLRQLIAEQPLHLA